jgi:hypothetical protein
VLWHVARLVVRLVVWLVIDYFASRRLVVDYFAYTMRLALALLVVDYFASRRLVVDYFAYAARPGASTPHAARRVARLATRH